MHKSRFSAVVVQRTKSPLDVNSSLFFLRLSYVISLLTSQHRSQHQLTFRDFWQCWLQQKNVETLTALVLQSHHRLNNHRSRMSASTDGPDKGDSWGSTEPKLPPGKSKRVRWFCVNSDKTQTSGSGHSGFVTVAAGYYTVTPYLQSTSRDGFTCFCMQLSSCGPVPTVERQSWCGTTHTSRINRASVSRT